MIIIIELPGLNIFKTEDTVILLKYTGDFEYDVILTVTTIQ